MFCYDITLHIMLEIQSTWLERSFKPLWERKKPQAYSPFWWRRGYIRSRDWLEKLYYDILTEVDCWFLSWKKIRWREKEGGSEFLEGYVERNFYKKMLLLKKNFVVSALFKFYFGFYFTKQQKQQTGFVKLTTFSLFLFLSTKSRLFLSGL